MTTEVTERPATDELAKPPGIPERDLMLSLTVRGATGRNVPAPSRYIPRPDVSVRPLLSLGGLFPTFGPTLPSVLDAGDVQFVTAGRIGIAIALEKMGVRRGEKVLIPAYHCINMIDPLDYTKAEPIFYRVKDDLSVDLDDVASKLTPDTRVLMATHYFGFPQDMPKIRKFCDDNDILLLEDCAHAFFGQCGGRPLGAWGDYSIASAKKFFPVYDGGCVITSRRLGRFGKLRSQGAKASVVAAVNVVGVAVYNGRLFLLRPLLEGASAAWRMVKGLRGADRGDADISAGGINPGQRESGGGGEFDVAWVDVAITGFSALVRRLVSHRRIVSRRRRNFELLRAGLSDIPGCRPIFSELPAGAVPYDFPLWIDDLDRCFPLLEDAAVPMHRFGQFLWPDMDESICPTTEAMSHHGVQLPCHQSLTKADIASIVARVRRIVGSNGA